MKNKLWIIICCFFGAIFLLPLINGFFTAYEDASLLPNDYARITEVDYKAVVVDEPGSEGKVVITERLTFDIHAAFESNLFWELWRDLPEDYVDGLKVDYKVNSVKQIMDDGTEIIYEESPKLYWEDEDYVSTNPLYGPGKWYHSEGPYDEDYAQYECVFFYVDGLYREKVVFEIQYEMRNAALRYNDCSDLYISLYSGETIKYLESFKAQILFPLKDMPKTGNFDVFTYGTNAHEFPVKGSATANEGYYTFAFELGEEELQFKSYNEYIEFDLVAFGEDKHIFTEYANMNDYSGDNVLEEIYEEQQEYASEPARRQTAKVILFVVLLLLSIFTVVFLFLSVTGVRGKYILYQPEMAPKTYREIPSDLDPNFAAAFVLCKGDKKKDDAAVYSAILLSLLRKGYVELQEDVSGELLITIKKVTQELVLRETSLQDPETPLIYEAPVEETPEREPLTPSEELYFNLLVRHAIGNSITMKEFESRVSTDYVNTEAFLKNMENTIVNIGVNEGYFQKADYLEPKKSLENKATLFMIFGILGLVFGNLITFVTHLDLVYGGWFIFGLACILPYKYIKKESEKYILLTQHGENEYAKWRGLYNFLNSEANLRDTTYVEITLWERYLIYAAAFGITEKVRKAIGVKFPEETESVVFENGCTRSRSYYRRHRHFHSHVHTTSSGVGGGGGFGYGGGGRGGGGGGGGH